MAAEYRERLAPAIDRVWREEIAALGRDLRVWVRRLPDAQEWKPSYFEFSFGLSDDGRDPRSVPDPVTIDGRFRLRGSIDLVELRHGGAEVRDHGSQDRKEPIDAADGDRRRRRCYSRSSTAWRSRRSLEAGRVRTAVLLHRRRRLHRARDPAQRANRRAGLEALEIVDRAIELGFLPPAPAPRACTWCDFRVVCGPDEERHAARKPADPLGDLTALRGMA